MMSLVAGLLLLLLPAVALAPLVPGRKDPIVAISGALAGALALHIIGFGGCDGFQWGWSPSPMGFLAPP